MHQNTEYVGPERRRIPTQHEVADMVAEELDERLAQMETNLINHMNVKMGQFELSITSSMKKIVEDALDQHIEEAFPRPIHKHKEHHQKLIDAAENGKKIKLDIQIWLIRGAIAFVGLLLFLGAKEWLLREFAK